VYLAAYVYLQLVFTTFLVKKYLPKMLLVKCIIIFQVAILQKSFSKLNSTYSLGLYFLVKKYWQKILLVKTVGEIDCLQVTVVPSKNA